jgi:hypothetical protein
MLAASRIRCGAILFLAAGAVFATRPTAHSEPVSPKSPTKVDFERHVMGLFGRMGCNSGSCHGSFQGRGGFRLSLFGYDPEKDYQAVAREQMGRRINTVSPEQSLLLLKAAGQVPHGGGRRFSKDSWQYRLLHDWIASGATWSKGSGAVAGVGVSPAEQAFTKAGETAQLTVKARFADGSEEDITPLCDFRVNDDAVAELVGPGQVKSLRAGDTAIVVSYRGNVVPVRALVPATAAPGFNYPTVPEVNYIDREVFAKLRRLNVVPSGLSGDAEFLRRVTIDTIGCLPTPDEVRAFLADADPGKRDKKIDELLAHPMHAALWATKFCDITGNNTDVLELPREKHSKMWHDWFRKRVADNMPYDEIVKGVLCATSRDGKDPAEWLKDYKDVEEALKKGFDTTYAQRASLDLYWWRQNANVPLEQWGEKAAAAFLGVRLECAQCHKHPFDRWTQVDYRSFANVFAQVKFGVSPEAQKLVNEENMARTKAAAGNNKNRQAAIREVFVANASGGGTVGKGRVAYAALTHPETNAPLPAKALGGPQIDLKTAPDARAELFGWMRSSDNTFFARSFANRVWGHYFGVGIVDPVDDFSLANPPSNPKLLDALAKDFSEHKYDIRQLERTILRSRTYQLSATPNATNRLDRNNYSHSFVRRLMAEVVVDVLNSALGVTEDWGGAGKGGGTDVPAGIRAIEVAPSRVQNQNLAYIFRIFGRSPRSLACDCERSMEPALPQTLYLMTDANLQQKLAKSRAVTLAKSTKSDDEVLDELFLATLSRVPRSDEKQVFAAYRAKKKDRQAALVDTLWALINTREFILNH